MSSARLNRDPGSNPAAGEGGGIKYPIMTARPHDALRVPPIDEALLWHLESTFSSTLYANISIREVDRQIGHQEIIEYLRAQYLLQQQK